MSDFRLQFQTKQLNKMTLIKAFTALVVIIAVMVATIVGITFAARSLAYNSALSAYTGWNENLASDVAESMENNNITLDFTAAMPESQAQKMLQNGKNGFEGVTIISPSGFIMHDTDHIFDSTSTRLPAGVELPSDGTLVSVVNAGDKSYAFAITLVSVPVDASEDAAVVQFYVGGYIDFSGSANAMKMLQTAAITIGILSTIIVIASFVTYVVTTGLNERGHRYKYRLVTDGEGKIVKSNAAFKEDFPQTLRLYDNVTHFSEKNLNAVKITSYEDDIFVACSAKMLTNGNVKLSADLLNMPYNSQATTPEDMMREAYTTFLPKGRPFLMGLICFADLGNIRDLFGREFAEQVHELLYERVTKRFKYIYTFDLFNLGVIFPPEGKEYEILLQDIKGIVDSYNKPLTIEKNIVNVKVKCGFAVCDSLMVQRNFDYANTACDAALRRAMQDKMKDYYVFHGDEIQQYAKYFFNYDIRQMLEDGMFEMEYQPQYGIKEGRIVGFEALFRVKKNANVFVNIFDLISYAERSGYMVLLGEFIFDTAMRFAKKVEDKGVTISLNVSPVQLMQAGFCENFLEIYDRYDLKEGVICVEITESFLVQNFEDAVKKLEILREHGIEIHLDDFGTRYSSLLYLKKLPVQVIKIDREFVMDIGKNDFDRSITEMILNICQKHNMLSISEGVETMEQYNILKDMGVDIIQGFLIGRSVPPMEAERLITEFKFRNKSTPTD